MNPDSAKALKQMIQARAEALLEEAGADSIPVNVIKVASYLGLPVFESEMEGSGAILLDEGGAPSVYVNAKHAPTRRRFTIAHEIGHFQLDHFQEAIDDEITMLNRSDVPEEGRERQEFEANHFAASLLMPETHVLEWWDQLEMSCPVRTARIREMAKIFDVSEMAMGNRLFSLGR